LRDFTTRTARRLGWTFPTYTGENAADLERLHVPFDGSPNFHTMWHLGVPRLSRLLVVTLRKVYGIRTPRALQYTSFKTDGSAQVRWPTLGLPRVSEPTLDGEARTQAEDDHW